MPISQEFTVQFSRHSFFQCRGRCLLLAILTSGKVMGKKSYFLNAMDLFTHLPLPSTDYDESNYSHTRKCITTDL